VLGTARRVGPKLQLIGIRIEPPEAPIVVVALEKLQGGVPRGGISSEAAIGIATDVVTHILAIVVTIIVSKDTLKLLIRSEITAARNDVLAEGLAAVLHAPRRVPETDLPIIEPPPLVGQGGVAILNLHDVSGTDALGASVGVGPKLELIVAVDPPLPQVFVGIAVVQLHRLAAGRRPDPDAPIAVAEHLKQGVVRLSVGASE